MFEFRAIRQDELKKDATFVKVNNIDEIDEIVETIYLNKQRGDSWFCDCVYDDWYDDGFGGGMIVPITEALLIPSEMIIRDYQVGIWKD